MFNTEFSVKYHYTGIEKEYSVPHEHKNTFEIIQALDDKGNMVIKNKLYPLKKGSLYLIDGICFHSPAPTDISGYCRNIITVSREYCLRIFNELELSSVLSELFISEGGKFCLLDDETAVKIDAIYKKVNNLAEAKESTFFQANIIFSIIEILKTAVKYQKKSPLPEKGHAGTALDLIEKNIAENLSLDILSEKLHISKYHLCRSFKQQTGFTVSGYINARRISLSKELIAEKDLSIAEISMKCGFSSQSYFGKIFFKFEGVSPSAYRKKVTRQ